MSKPGGVGLDDDVSAVVKVLVSRLDAGVGAGSGGVEPPVVGFGDRDTAVARAQGWRGAHDVVRAEGEAPDECGEKRCSDYQRTTGLPALAESRRPGFNSLWSREPGWHAYAPKLDRARPWSVRSAVRMRAIGTTTLRPTTRQVNRVSQSVVPRDNARSRQRAGPHPERTRRRVGQLMFGALTPRPPSGLRWCFDVTTLRSAPDLGGILDRPWRAGSTGARNTDALINDPAAGSCLVRISGVDSAPARAEGLARRADGRAIPTPRCPGASGIVSAALNITRAEGPINLSTFSWRTCAPSTTMLVLVGTARL